MFQRHGPHMLTLLLYLACVYVRAPLHVCLLCVLRVVACVDVSCVSCTREFRRSLPAALPASSQCAVHVHQ